MKTQLEVKDLSKAFGQTVALKNAGFNLDSYEIHALVGENGAGKSTLMKILSGVYFKDSGHIFLEGNEINPSNPTESHQLGISTVFQELSLCHNLSIAENIFVNRVPTRWGIIRKKALNKMTRKYLNNFHVDLNPETILSDLNIAKKQIVEIIKAVSLKPKILILDEPTSSLEITETKILFELLLKLKNDGAGIIFISHKLDEVFQIADRITVFRDGQSVACKLKNQTNQDEIIKFMVGREISQIFPPKNEISENQKLQIKNFSYQKKFQNINFNLHDGEILGFAGLTGAGRSEVMQSIFGYEMKDCGEVFYKDKLLQIYNPGAAIKNRIIYSPEDRKQQGLFLNHSVAMNITSTSLDKCSNFSLMKKNKEVQLADKFVKDLSIKVSSINQDVSSLSGGNQQKVLLAKCLVSDPDIFIVDEPTRGIDIGSKIEIYNLLRNFANKGGSVILISSELPELIGLSDRIIVFKQGRIVGELKNNISENSIMNLIFKTSLN